MGKWQSKWSGIYPILYAFWNEQGALDEAAMRTQVEHCIASGAHGIAVLGLVTEVHKMDVNERLHLVEMVGDMISARVPYAVTVGEPSLAGQVAFAKAAAQAGADWVILQPPPIKGTSQADLIRFFGSAADALDVDVAIQNNPIDLDVSLSPDALIELNKLHSNISILKGEGFSVDIARTIEGSAGAYQVFGGYGGIEFPALLRSGGSGLIPAPDFLKAQVIMFEAWRAGDIERAEVIHRQLLPAIVFMSRSIPGLLCYGKRLVAEQIGLPEPFDRTPALQPTEFGLSEMADFKQQIDQACRLT